MNSNLSPFAFSASDLLWLGNQQSVAEINHRLHLLQQGILPHMMMMPMEPEEPEDEDEDEMPTRYVELKGRIAVITTKGPLTNEKTFMQWLLNSATTYNQVRSAFFEAVELKRTAKCDEILHIIHSPGGASLGLEETAAAIRQIATEVCPVTTYGNLMCSAGYWLGMAGSKVYAPATADIGSIGTRMTVMNYYEAMKQEGITAHTLTAGKFKSMGDPTQPWNKATEEYLQSRVDDINSIFLDYVAEYRNQPLAYVEEKMAQGREFTGKQAYDNHLTDGIVTLDVLVQRMQSALASKRRMM